MGEELIDFNLEKVSPSIIMVAGVGGGGSNAVNHMFELGIADVTFMVCNTDRQALYRSPVPIKVKLGENLTEGLGAGNNPDRGKAAALESLDEMTAILKREGTKMIFITAGMGGGTGTGAAPIIAKAAKELGVLTVGIVTLPFIAEGRLRSEHAKKGIEEMRQNVDSLLVINNESIQDIYGKLPLTEAFGKADDILASAAKGIAEIITGDGMINVDFADVRTVMTDSGVALMGTGRASGEHRAQEVADAALNSPLLNHNYINGAKNILINITSGEEEILLDEANRIIEYIQERAGNDANIIWGAGRNFALGTDIAATIIATGFNGLTPGDNAGSKLPPLHGHKPYTPLDTPNPFGAPRQFGGEGSAGNNIGAPRNQTADDRRIKVSEDRRFVGIDNLLASPAFSRRKVTFATEPEEKRTTVKIKEETAEEETKPKAPSLFD